MECAQVTEEQRLWTETQIQKAKHNAWPSCLASVYLTQSACAKGFFLIVHTQKPSLHRSPHRSAEMQIYPSSVRELTVEEVLLCAACQSRAAAAPCPSPPIAFSRALIPTLALPSLSRGEGESTVLSPS